MGKLNKPDVDDIIGISPSIAIEQKINITNPRSTVGTKSEIYDYLKLLFARIGQTFSPETGEKIIKDDKITVIKYLKKLKVNSKVILSSPIKLDNKKYYEKLKTYSYQGFARIFYNNKLIKISEIKKPFKNNFGLVIRRIIIDKDFDYLDSLADEVDLAFYEGKGECEIIDLENMKTKRFSNKFSDEIRDYKNPNVHLFSFNNPFGACEKCQGYGDIIGIDPTLVIPDTSISIYENAISPWKGAIGKKYLSELLNNAYKFDFPIHKPYFKLTKKQKEVLWSGNTYFKGINNFFKKIERKNYKIQNRVLLSRYRGRTICNRCNGNRLKKETDYIKIGDKNINDLVNLTLDELLKFFKKLKLTDNEKKISKILIYEIQSRLKFLNNIGLNYLNLNRRSNSLSGGESQRINIASSLGSSLIGSIYILDEPSIGLHSKDNLNLIKVLKKLKNIGNTVLVVEHDEEIMKSADHIIDMGPKAGSEGGFISCEGNFNDILLSNSLTSKYLNGTKSIKIPLNRRKSGRHIKIIGARENNLKNINVEIPLNTFTAITGVSGSGKSTLVKKILYPSLLNKNGIYNHKPGEFDGIETNFNLTEKVEYINQNPIGRSSRSNPVTYLKAYDDIRLLYANQELSKSRNLKPKHFSFNVDGGRCESCLGEGTITIEMQFMADVKIKCENCHGKRFKKEIIDIKYKNNSIDDLLNMTITEAINFFIKNDNNKISKKLQPLEDVGLGYIKLGQSSSTLSGGEAQRIKLASFLNKGLSKEKIIFIFDEPTTGLHFHDIKKLLKSFNSLIELGHSIIVVEHNLDLIKCSDYIIDLGPDGGNNGGYIVAQGTPEEISKNKKSYTGSFLKNKLLS